MRGMDAYRAMVDAALPDMLPKADHLGAKAVEAARYSLLGGGKRIRPSLLLAACECCGGSADEALYAACALECIHTYSLIHDDLPVMDDDDMRRGRPSCHAAYGEAMALLAGDGLLTHAFELIAQGALAAGAAGARHLRALRDIAAAAGFSGMVGGQVADIAADDGGDAALLGYIHQNKTAALFQAAVLAGAHIGGADEDALGCWRAYGLYIGLAFQAVDDILDATATPQQLGKTPGKDASGNKLTLVSLLGLEGAKERAAQHSQRAADALAPLGAGADALAKYALSLADRRG